MLRMAVEYPDSYNATIPVGWGCFGGFDFFEEGWIIKLVKLLHFQRMTFILGVVCLVAIAIFVGGGGEGVGGVGVEPLPLFRFLDFFAEELLEA
jgi:hypothetical protein